MKTAFIVAEYNPFHNGHRYHVQQTREKTDADAVVAVMSGHFVQRGDIAIGDKFLRAEAAVRCGVDLVVELPVKYAVSNASRFAVGAIRTINAFGIDGVVSFGASSSLEELEQALRVICDEKVQEQIVEISKTKGKTYPAALDVLLRYRGDFKTADVLTDPNNVLALEYLKAIAQYDTLRPLAVERSLEKGHHADAGPEGYAGASYIRQLIEKNSEDHFEILRGCRRLIPDPVAELLQTADQIGRFPTDRRKYDAALYSRLLLLKEEDFSKIDNVSHGLENRIVQVIRSCSGTDEAIAAIKSKRYTMARLRQIVTAAALGIRKEDAASLPTYLRVLAFNENGRKLLGQIRSTAELPVVTNLSDAIRNPLCAADAELEYSSDKLFDLCLPVPRGGNRPFLDHPVYVKNCADS